MSEQEPSSHPIRRGLGALGLLGGIVMVAHGFFRDDVKPQYYQPGEQHSFSRNFEIAATPGNEILVGLGVGFIGGIALLPSDAENQPEREREDSE